MNRLQTMIQFRWGLALALIVLLVAAPAARQQVGAAPAIQSGMLCTTNSTATFTLTAREGTIQMSDGNAVYMWGYGLGNGDFQYPGPVLCVNEGDNVTIVLKNALQQDTSLVFPGQENVMANGAPSQPQVNAQGQLWSLAQAAPANGGTATYSFVASKPGTYIYQSGTNAMIQVQMGLFGALVVRPLNRPGWAYNNEMSAFNPNTEFIQMLSEIDPVMHSKVQAGESFDFNNFLPRYWLINGRGFPDTLAPNNAAWLPAQPYSALVHIQVYDPTLNNQPALVRYINFGFREIPFHPHGNHSRLIARDGNFLAGSGNQDLSNEHFSMGIGPGQTWDATLNWRNVENYNPETNPVPVLIPRDQNLVFGPFFSGSPYLGSGEPLPPGETQYNQCGEYYHLAHNHALNQIVAWGVVNGGQVTFTRVDPLGGCPVR